MQLLIRLSLKRFQSTHPRRVRQDEQQMQLYCDKFQSTHPRRVRLYEIHTCVIIKCFNPRTHVGCDSRSSGFRYENLRFNPRTHVGCDLRTCPAPSRRCWFQSTHPRRVRPFALHCFDKGRKFQSTHPRRVRRALFLYNTVKSEFQSTHPRRVRQNDVKFAGATVGFNPRTHVGCDLTNYIALPQHGVSIHAPT